MESSDQIVDVAAHRTGRADEMCSSRAFRVMTVDGVTDRLREQKDSPCASSGGGGKSLSLQHERVVIQDRGFGCRRSPPWGGCDRVGPPQAAPCRPASAGTGDDELRWNADHHAGHALPATPRARSGAGNGADRGAATQGRGAPPGSPRAAAAVLMSPRFNARHRSGCPSRRGRSTRRRRSPTPASGSRTSIHLSR